MKNINNLSFPKSVIGNLNLRKTKEAEVPDNDVRVRQYKSAFTLIELLVVVLIIGILSAIALPQYQQAVEKARVAEAMIVLRNIADANKRYYLANGEYTWSLANLDIEVPGESTTFGEMDRKKTKSFEYGARINSKTDTSGVIAVANGPGYMLVIFQNGETVQCYPYSAEGIRKCKTFGATSASEIGVFYPITI